MKNKSSNVQIYKCLEYQKRFTVKFGFGKTRVAESTITRAMQVYFSRMCVRDIVNHYEMMDIKIIDSSVYRRIAKYSKMVENTLVKLYPER